MRTYIKTKDTRPKDTTRYWMKDLFFTCIDDFLKGFFPKLHHQFTSSFTPIAAKKFNLFTFPLHNGTNIGMKTKRNGDDVILFIHVATTKTPLSILNERIHMVKIALQKHFLIPVIPVLVTLYEHTPSEDMNVSNQLSPVQILKRELEDYLKNENIVALALLYKFVFTECEREQYSYDIFRKVVQMQANLKENRLLYQFFTC